MNLSATFKCGTGEAADRRENVHESIGPVEDLREEVDI